MKKILLNFLVSLVYTTGKYNLQPHSFLLVTSINHPSKHNSSKPLTLVCLLFNIDEDMTLINHSSENFESISFLKFTKTFLIVYNLPASSYASIRTNINLNVINKDDVIYSLTNYNSNIIYNEFSTNSKENANKEIVCKIENISFNSSGQIEDFFVSCNGSFELLKDTNGINGLNSFVYNFNVKYGGNQYAVKQHYIGSQRVFLLEWGLNEYDESTAESVYKRLVNKHKKIKRNENVKFEKLNWLIVVFFVVSFVLAISIIVFVVKGNMSIEIV